MPESKWCNDPTCDVYRPTATDLCPFCLDKLIKDMGHGDTFDAVLKGTYLEGIKYALDECYKIGIITGKSILEALLKDAGRLS